MQMFLSFTLSDIFPGIAGADLCSEVYLEYFYLLSVMSMNFLTFRSKPSRIPPFIKKP